MPLRSHPGHATLARTLHWCRERSFLEGRGFDVKAAQFWNRRVEAMPGENLRNFCPQSAGRSPLFLMHSCPEKVADFFFHTSAVAAGAALEAGLDLIFDIANHQLRHNDIMIPQLERKASIPRGSLPVPALRMTRRFNGHRLILSRLRRRTVWRRRRALGCWGGSRGDCRCRRSRGSYCV